MAVNIDLNKQKLRGGYYTSPTISNFLANWAIRSSDETILEPSCGDGNILVEAINRLQSLGTKDEQIVNQIYGVEFDPDEAEKTSSRIRDLNIPITLTTIHSGDFFEHSKSELIEKKRFDCIIGNPPFIRYQDFISEQKEIAFEIMKTKGFNPSKLTNAWVPFLVISSLLLNDKGRLGMVIPAELFQVNYTAETRQFLSDFFPRITIVTFKKLLFPDAQQEVVLLLCEREKSDVEGIRVAELFDENDLDGFNIDNLSSLDVKPVDHSSEKWTQYFLSSQEIFLLRNLREREDLKNNFNVLDVDVGIVTGNNKYFLLTEKQIKDMNLEEEYLTHLVSRSNHLDGIRFMMDDWKENYYNQLPANMFTPANLDLEELPENVKGYILLGEATEVNKGYKCRIRKRWYIVPSVWIPDAFMLRQVHLYPKLILNEASATCTDTIHRVRFKGDYNKEQVTVAFLNSLTFAFAEISGRSYGGGVLTFEPSEAESLPIPLVGASELNIKEIDKLIRNNDIEAVLDITDNVLLRNGLGLSEEEVVMLRGIWNKMKNRRINRKK